VERRVLFQLTKAGLQSAHGQSLFFSSVGSERQHGDDLERYWQATILKSGSIYRAGAAVVQLRDRLQELIEALGDYGSALGVMLQVLDDCRDRIDDPVKHPDLPGLPALLEN